MSGRVASLDYLRGTAAASVAIPHFFVYHSIQSETFEAVSALGVEIFFVLSGYVLASQLFFVMSEQRAGTLGIFLVRRWMRTIPAYVVALCAISLLLGKIGDADFYRYLLYAQNLFRQSNGEDYFTVAWSLSVEEWFYVIFPLVLLLAIFVAKAKNVRKTALIAAIVFIAVISLCRLFFGNVNDWGSSVRRVVCFRINSIAFGFLLYAALQDKPALPARLSGLRIGAAGLTFFGIAAFWLALGASQGSVMAKHLFPFGAGLFGACTILIALKLEPKLALAPAAAAVGVALGSFSYSIYLFHTIFLTLIGSAFGNQWLSLQFIIFALLMAAFSASFYHSFEKPILMLRPGYRRRGSAELPPAASMPAASITMIEQPDATGLAKNA